MQYGDKQYNNSESDLRVLVTGASGFIGHHVINRLLVQSIPHRIALRQNSSSYSTFDTTETVELSGSGTDSTDWPNAVANCHSVIHLAGLTQVDNTDAQKACELFQQANVSNPIACAKAAINAGVQRFIFLSSVMVHGGTSGNQPFDINSAMNAQTIYAQSKIDAELALTNLVQGTQLELVIIRPTLVYGPAVKGNFQAMLKYLALGIPLPFGCVDNKRSLTGIENLVDLIISCLYHPNAANQIFMVSDGYDLSTTEIIQKLRSGLDQPRRLIPVPAKWLAYGAHLLGRKDLSDRLLGNLQVDISKTKNMLNWTPPITVDQGLRETTEWYLRQR